MSKSLFDLISRPRDNNNNEVDSKFEKKIVGTTVDVNSPNSNGETLLTVAIKNGYNIIALLLLELGAEPNGVPSEKTRLLKRTQSFLSSALGTTSENQTRVSSVSPILLASKQGMVDVVQKLIEKGAVVKVVDEDGNEPLHLAAAFGRLKVVEYLLSIGASTQVKAHKQYTPLVYAAEAGHAHVCRKLLNSGSDPNARIDGGSTALHLACAKGHEETVQIFLRFYANATLKDRHGNTCIFLAIQNKHSSIIDEMMEHMPSLALEKDGDLRTPLHAAVEVECPDIVNALLKFGEKVDPNTKDKFGRTPLHIAADNGNFQCAKLLLQHGGADINISNAFEETPLMIAINNVRYSVALLLVEFGCYLGFYLDERNISWPNTKEEMVQYLKVMEGRTNKKESM